MGKAIDLTDQKFGRWTVIERYKSNKNGYVSWLCECSCMNKTRRVIRGDNLRNGTTKSCGCIKQYINNNIAWKYEIGKNIKDDKRDITITGQFRNKDKRYNYQCNKCGWNEGTTRECHIDAGQGCACCSGFVIVEGINDIPSKAPWMVELIKGGYEIAKNFTVQSSSMVEVICPYCYKEKSIRISNLYRQRRVSCICGDGKSYPEKFMTNVLDQLKLEYKRGYRSEWLKGYEGSKRSAEFDFFLPTYNLFIEMDGGMGHGHETSICALSGVTPEKSIAKDNWKDDQAILHGYKVYRIDSAISDMEYLKREISSNLYDVFDLSGIDWLECDKSGLKNIIKDVADYYMKNKPISTAQIGDIFNVSAETIRRYLEKAVKHNWCDYSVESARKLANQRCAKRAIDNCSKKVQVYKDGIVLGEYPSASDLSRKSIVDFGVKFHLGNICNVACGGMSAYKGYKFKYVA